MDTPLSPSEPTLALQLEPETVRCDDAPVGYTVINYNTAALTLRCVVSLSQCDEPPAWIVVLDNASAQADFDLLQRSLRSVPNSQILLFRSVINLGFAAGSNFLIDWLLRFRDCRFVGLLNNDAVARPGLVRGLREALVAGGAMAGMSGGRMHKLKQPSEVDTLGITLYASLMPADRKSINDPYLGPTGGCCLMTRAFVEDVKATTGYCFDERYFCYCEDTDLVLRANLLGYRPVYVDELVALHEGQASSRGQYNTFVAYHGLRNAMWMHWKLIPTSLLVRSAPWLLLAHLLTIARQVLSGRLMLLYVVYRDALKCLPVILAERARLRPVFRVRGAALRNVVSGRFYRQGYAAVVLAEWKARWFGHRKP